MINTPPQTEHSNNNYTMIGDSKAMYALHSQIGKVAPTDAGVLILGETGVGKELVAREIHRRSGRGNFVDVNCPGIPSDLFESYLFGHVRGAFTGAIENKPGYVAQANNGTLFLDEIGAMPPYHQERILRFLQERTVSPVGGSTSTPVNVRVIAATNSDLERSIQSGTFRMDLFFRLNPYTIRIPPLRERLGDIPVLAHHFAYVYSVRYKKM